MRDPKKVREMKKWGGTKEGKNLQKGSRVEIDSSFHHATYKQNNEATS
jgi:hypothetical protein